MPSLKSCNFGKVNLMHPYFQKSGSNSSFWTWGQETQRGWRADPNGLDPGAVILVLFNLTAHPAFLSLTTKHFTLPWTNCAKSVRGPKAQGPGPGWGWDGYRTLVSTSAKLRPVIRKGSQRHSSDLGMEHPQSRVRPRAPKRPLAHLLPPPRLRPPSP